MLSKQQFSSLIKENFLWPGYNWSLRNTIDGLVGGSNEYIDGIVEILIDYLYQRYLYVEDFTKILDINTTDSDKEEIRIKSKNTLPVGTIINIYGTINYNKKYVIFNAIDSDYIYIRDIYTYEEIKNTSYYTVISPDGYTESSPNYFEECLAENLGDVNNSVYLPLMSHKTGLRYNPNLSIEENRRLVKSAISIYKIKGTILSIKRVMSILGFACDVIEPYKLMLQYGKSSYNSQSHFQDWKLYHDGVFEIITDNISINDYSKQISALVQPAGTRLIGRANIYLGLLPVLEDIIIKRSNSYFIELFVQCFKYGNIFDALSADRTRSGRTELRGIFADISTYLDVTTQYRRVWDSTIFSFRDLSEPILKIVPAGSFSQAIGAYSSISTLVMGWSSEYDETSPLDKQLELLVISRDERPARRSEVANKRSGSASMSGLDGDHWDWKPYTFLSSEVVTPIIAEDVIKLPIEIDVEFNSISSFVQYSGTVLDVNRLSSGFRNIYGIEIILGYRYPTLEDWEEKIYWMWTDFTCSADLSSGKLFQKQSQDFYHELLTFKYHYNTEYFNETKYLSGNMSCDDIEIIVV